MWIALWIVLGAAVLGTIFGLLVAQFVIKSGLCGHPQCQPEVRKRKETS